MMSYFSTEPPTDDERASWEATERRMKDLREREAPYLDAADENDGGLITGCWCPSGHCTCDADDFHRSEFA